MALPAGFSDEEYDSDNDGVYFLEKFSKIKRIVPALDEDRLTLEQKLINAVKDKAFLDVRLLLEKGADVNFKPELYGWPPLMLAASVGDSKLIELLLQKGADPNISVKLTTPLICLCDCGSSYDNDELLKCFNLLVDAGANINAYNVHRETPLMLAADQGHVPLVVRLLEVGSEVDFTNCEGWSAIHYAVKRQNAEIVRLLKEAGCTLTLVDVRGHTLSDLAEANNCQDIVKLLASGSLENDVVSECLPTNNVTSFKFVCSEMPNYNESDFNGFNEDVIGTISGIGMKNLIPLFLEKKIGYGNFLINTDEDWKKFGIKMCFDRKKMMHFAYDIIQKNWSSEALINCNEDDMTLFRMAQKFSNDVRVVHILIATCYVCKRELNKVNAEVDHNKLGEILTKSMCEVKLLRATISKIDDIIEAIEKDSVKCPADFIFPKSSYSDISFYVKRYRFYSYIIISLLGFNFLFMKLAKTLKKLYNYFQF